MKIKKIISIAAVMLIAASSMAKWNVIHDEAGNQIISFFETEDRAEIGTKFTLHSYTNEFEAVDKTKALIASGAKVFEGVVIPTNAPDSQRYVYENAFLLICDQLTSKTNHTKMPMEDLTMILLQVRAVNKDRYEIVRDALNMINSSLSRYDVKWWDYVEYRDIPSVVIKANQLMSLIQ